jgi:hypothetical protein
VFIYHCPTDSLLSGSAGVKAHFQHSPRLQIPHYIHGGAVKSLFDDFIDICPIPRQPFVLNFDFEQEFFEADQGSERDMQVSRAKWKEGLRL